ncbi:flagellar hook-associated protein FlgL [Pseudoduganella albidiflava]|uniref:Flagellar hook-associated protein 3 n=1 Tax=Pseudoduganella albidiflava TaxID=321983 RepID=A0A411WWC4_9BURK|nr:flagellar hook-associated protein FlgL [Pseudoduganella albidiflava]QBI01055.1 flagellar hook-associated protein 3 [Pseudoduganella albidiflava]GGY47740.1 flagellar hook-associated protein 3 [Pseudoduganella albidiflava]
MRIATTQYQATLARSLELNQTMASRLTQQMASGKAVMLPSDDPISHVRISRLTREEAIIDQYRENIGAVKIRLSKNESYLSGMVGDLTKANDLLVWAADGGNTPDDLKSMVDSLVAIRDSVLYTANTRDQEGKYLFSGTMTDTPPIAFDGASYSYAGNAGEQKVVVGNGITQTVNVNAGGVDALLNKLTEAIDALRNTTTDSSAEPLKGLISETMTMVQSTQDDLAGKVAKLGGAQNVLATLDSNHANVSLSNKSAMTELGQLDYGVAASELSGYNMALQATYQSYSKISNLSLFNVL